jgi:hypothetical protein
MIARVVQYFCELPGESLGFVEERPRHTRSLRIPDVSTVFDVPTSVTAVIFICSSELQCLSPSSCRLSLSLAMRVVTAVAPIRADHTGRQSKDTCYHDVASYAIEGIHTAEPTY